MNWYKKSSQERFEYIGCCVTLLGDFVSYLVDHSIEIKLEEFEIAVPNWKEYDPYPEGRKYLPVEKDRAFSFWKSVTPSGISVYYFDNSSIEYIFVSTDSHFNLEEENNLAISEDYEEKD